MMKTGAIPRGLGPGEQEAKELDGESDSRIQTPRRNRLAPGKWAVWLYVVRCVVANIIVTIVRRMTRLTRARIRVLPIWALALAGCGDTTEPPAPRPRDHRHHAVPRRDESRMGLLPMSLRIALALLLGCDQPVEPEPEPAHPAAMHLTPRETELSALGSTIRLIAEVRDQYGQVMPPEVVNWASDSPRVASVDASGLVTAIANGTAMVQASAGTVSRNAKVAVAQVTAKLVLEPHLDTLLIGDTLRLAAEAFDANSHAIPWAAIAWTSQDPRIAEVDASGLVTAVAVGTVVVEASTVSGVTGGAEIEVVPPVLVPSAVSVTPDSVVFEALGQTQRLSAKVFDQFGLVMEGAAVVWTSGDTTVAVVDSAGVVTAVAEGTAAVAASAGTVSGTAVVTVAQVAGSVVVTPLADTVESADTLRLAAEAFDENGHAVQRAAFTWSSSDASVATVDATGLVRGTAEGTATITAAAGGGRASGTSEITVVNPDRAVLLALYEATGGPNWNRSDNWLTDAPLGNWYGVWHDGRRFWGLGLHDNNLTGRIPEELGNLSALVVLKLDGNNLTGEIPPELGDLLALKELSLRNNDLTGEIPPELGDLLALKELSLRNNDLTGEIPPELGDLLALKELSLRNNDLTGEIPPELGNLTALTELDLTSNDLTGPIPAELGKLSALESLSIQWNALTGEIPPELGHLTALTGLYLSSNDLTGPIPAELGKLSALESLSIQWNALTGEIPPELGHLTALTGLALTSNNLTGPIPADLGNLTALEWLLLGDNDLTGPIPPELAALANLGEYGLSLDVGPGELCAPEDPKLRAWLLGLGVSALPCLDPSFQLLPRALLREDGTGVALLLPDELGSPSAVTVSDPSVVTASVRDGRWLDLVPSGRGSATVEVVPSGQGVPGVAEVVVRRAEGTFGIEIVVERPALIGSEEAITAAVDWWSSVLNGTEWPRPDGFRFTCGNIAVPLGDPVGLFIDVIVREGGRGQNYCFGRFRSSGTISLAPSMGCCRWPSDYDRFRREIGVFLGLAGQWSPFTEASELLSKDGAYFVGKRATAAFRAGGGDPSLPGVPLANRRFWHGDHVPCELMSTGSEDCGRLTMDSISLAALADAGYTVDMSKVTPWRKGK